MWSPEFRAAFRALARAEMKYDAPSYARALNVIERLPADQPETLFLRAAVAHALAELRGDERLMREAIRGYEEAAPGLHPAVRDQVPALVAECHDQLREAGAE